MSNPIAVKFVSDSVTSSSTASTSQNFNLIPVVDVAYSFFSINELRLFDTDNQQIVCVAELPYNNPFALNPPSGVANGTIYFNAKSSQAQTNNTSSSSDSEKQSSSVSSTTSISFLKTLAVVLLAVGIIM